MPVLSHIAGRDVLFVMATTAEYGPKLKRLITPVITGVGPVEAAIGTTAALVRLSDRDKLPDLVISLGSAGSDTLEQGAVYQARSVSYRDMDASPLGFTKGATPFLDEPVEITLPLQLAGLPAARLSTGGNIISGAAYRAIDADMVDMESFAVCRACRQFGVPMIGLRGISDGAKELHHYDDWAALLEHIDGELAAIIESLPERLPASA